MRFRNATILIGPNGCGKSVELEALANRAYARLKYIPMQRHTSLKGVGFARQGRAIPFLAPTVVGALASALLVKGVSLSESYSITDELRQATRMMHIRNRSFRYLSGGEAQIVNVLSAIVSATDGVFLDDPFSMLDSDHRNALIHVLAGVGSFVPSGKVVEADIVITLGESSDDKRELAWLHAKDRLEISVEGDEKSRAAMGRLLDLGNALQRKRSGVSSFRLESFTLSILPSDLPLFEPLTCELRQGILYELRAPNGVGKSMALAALFGLSGCNRVHAIVRSMLFRVYPRLVRHGKVLSFKASPNTSAIFIPQHCEMLTADNGPLAEFESLLTLIPEDRRKFYEEALIALGIDDRRIGEYSLGEARFISAVIGLLGALVDENIHWVFLDEIDSRLDPVRRVLIKSLIAVYLASGGGIVMATHTEDPSPFGQQITLRRSNI